MKMAKFKVIFLLGIIFISLGFQNLGGERLKINSKPTGVFSLSEISHLLGAKFEFEPILRKIILKDSKNPHHELELIIGVPYLLVNHREIREIEPPQFREGEIIIKERAVREIARGFGKKVKIEGDRVLIECLSASWRIFLDPGHGGRAPGAIKGKIKEKDLVLDIARRAEFFLKKKLKSEVFLTRREDVEVELDERIKVANQKKADVFISIHINACGKPQRRGVETYIFDLTATDEESARLAKVENKSVEDFKKLILKDLRKHRIHPQTLKLAKCLQESLVVHTGLLDGGIKKAPFWVLSWAEMPAVLLEIGYLSNEKDRKLLSSKAFREKVAQGIVSGLIKYFQGGNGVISSISKENL
jgi:N-acetylmuramoyl-L-alanine amidase